MISVDIIDYNQTSASLRVEGRAVHISLATEDATLDNDAALGHSTLWDSLVQRDAVSLTRMGDFIIVPRFVPGGQNAAASGNAVIAPRSGKVISVLVEPGATVAADQPLVILEAMKMEMTLKSPRDGVVSEVTAVVGVLVDDGQALVTLEDVDA